MPSGGPASGLSSGTEQGGGPELPDGDDDLEALSQLLQSQVLEQPDDRRWPADQGQPMLAPA
jgi:hypothetical protein